MVNRTSLTVLQLNDSHAYFELHQEMFWQGGQAEYGLDVAMDNLGDRLEREVRPRPMATAV
jgi:hypothetical protein